MEHISFWSVLMMVIYWEKYRYHKEQYRSFIRQ